MRYAIISDIHANLDAFRAVLDHIKAEGGVEELWNLGDIVGYGPEPHECIELLRQSKHISVAGNHDLVSIDKIDTTEFNPDAAAAAKWTARQLTPSDMEYLTNLPLVTRKSDFTLVHGSPREPIWEYITSTDSASENLAYFETSYCLIGHSHLPLVFTCKATGCSVRALASGDRVQLGEERLIINPGGIGQPRDGDPRASYAIYDSETRQIELYRVPYDIRSTQSKMMQSGLPVHLIERLGFGF